MLVEWKEPKDAKEEKSRQEIYSNIMLVRILRTDQKEAEDPGELRGEIIHLNLPKPIPYQGLTELVFRIEGIARLLNLQTGNEESGPSGDGAGYRSLGSGPGGKASVLPQEYCRIVPTEQRAREGFCRGLHLKKAQEVVCVELLGRHHMSLQGRLRCKSTAEQYVYFRSALELMHLFSELSRNERHSGEETFGIEKT